MALQSVAKNHILLLVLSTEIYAFSLDSYCTPCSFLFYSSHVMKKIFVWYQQNSCTSRRKMLAPVGWRLSCKRFNVNFRVYKSQPCADFDVHPARHAIHIFRPSIAEAWFLPKGVMFLWRKDSGMKLKRCLTAVLVFSNVHLRLYFCSFKSLGTELF